YTENLPRFEPTGMRHFNQLQMVTLLYNKQFISVWNPRTLASSVQPAGEAMKTKRVAIYARVSTDQQTTENQLAELRAWAQRAGHAVIGEFVDHAITGAKGRDSRPQLDRLLKGVARREFDVIAAWSVDRLGRSLQHLVGFLADI